MKALIRSELEQADDEKVGSINLLTLNLPNEGVQTLVRLSGIIWVAHFIAHLNTLQSTLSQSWGALLANIVLLFVLYHRRTGALDAFPDRQNPDAAGASAAVSRRTTIVLTIWAVCMFAALQIPHFCSWLDSCLLAYPLLIGVSIGLLMLGKIVCHLQ